MRRFGCLLILVLVGCKKGKAEAESHAAKDYAGASGRVFVFNLVSEHAGDTGDTGADTADTASDSGGVDTAGDTATDTGEEPAPLALTLEIGDTEWVLTLLRADTLAWSVTDGLVVGETSLLPASVTSGATAEGVTVNELGPRTVWYGTFPDVASVTSTTGTLAGDWAFARDVGPIAGQYLQQDWELVYYQ